MKVWSRVEVSITFNEFGVLLRRKKEKVHVKVGAMFIMVSVLGSFVSWRLSAGAWRLSAGTWMLREDWGLKAGACRLEVGAWSLEAGRWMLETN